MRVDHTGMESMPKEIEITKFRVLIVGSSFGFDPLRLTRRVQREFQNVNSKNLALTLPTLALSLGEPLVLREISFARQSLW